ncbi:RNA pseudouridine synthase 2, chloroplastic [Vitis vinifera]|uniref:RNA pseudouridine synthase 2, chloroplastic n=1 Tax=Vitis vinifera TaxID=29760 RepID=A0A438ETE1_VITVI|nr:RNA pseudouridine synthase 2, chloroplastic [Vitis vinifera]
MIFSLNSASFFSISHTSQSVLLFPRNPKSCSRVFRILRACSNSTDEPLVSVSGRRTNYAGVRLEETVVDVNSDSGKLRLDSWISSRIIGISRARVQSSIRSGLVSVNDRIVDKELKLIKLRMPHGKEKKNELEPCNVRGLVQEKLKEGKCFPNFFSSVFSTTRGSNYISEQVSHVIRAGDKVNCTISELQPLRAEPEDIPLDIVYEDEHVLVVNKPAHMVVHPAPGNASGTLVNGILHHCSLPTVALPNRDSEEDDISDDEFNSFAAGQNCGTCETNIRPGIVHRLDKGTSGLLVVAKDEHSHAHLSEQFKLHSIHRVYISLTSGVPTPLSGRVEIPVGRDPNNRIRMTAVPGPSNSGQARHAASRYKVIEILAAGGSALVEWRLETGRTHQIRAHAKYLGIPLLGDEVYGGTKNMALSLLRPRIPSSHHGQLAQLVSRLDRPCLHAVALGFNHPKTGKNVHFSCQPPEDFAEILSWLRKISTEKVQPLTRGPVFSGGKPPIKNHSATIGANVKCNCQFDFENIRFNDVEWEEHFPIYGPALAPTKFSWNSNICFSAQLNTATYTKAQFELLHFNFGHALIRYFPMFQNIFPQSSKKQFWVPLGYAASDSSTRSKNHDKVIIPGTSSLCHLLNIQRHPLDVTFELSEVGNPEYPSQGYQDHRYLGHYNYSDKE